MKKSKHFNPLRSLFAASLFLTFYISSLSAQTINAACTGSLEFLNSNDAVLLPTPTGVKYYGNNGFTWECWVKLTTPFSAYSSALLRPIICCIDPVVYEDICLSFGWTGGVGNVPMTHLAFKVDGPTGPCSVSCDYVPAGGFLMGTWYHVAGVMDYVNHKSTLYLNGVQVDSRTVNSAPFSRVIPTQLSWDIAVNPGGVNPPLGGNMDEVRIWSCVRTPAEIAAYYDKCLAGNEPNLLLYYRCNQASGSVATDAAVNSYNGTLTHSAAWSTQQPNLTGSNCGAPALVLISGNTSICSGQTATLAASGALTYVWSAGRQTTSSITVTPANNQTYTVTGTDACGSSNSSATVNVFSVNATISGSTNICSGQAATLTASGGGTYFWSPGGQNTSTINPTLTGTYSVIASIGSCSDTAAITVNAFAAPNMSLSSLSNVSCNGGNDGAAAAAASGGTPPYNYYWNPAGGTDSIAIGLTAGDYFVQVTDSNGCARTGNISISEPPNISIALPNAFSPNKDGENEKFCLQGTSGNCIAEIEISIYNRWGGLVYQSNEKNFCWDGTCHDKLENTAVFAYFLKGKFTNENTFEKKGSISLIR